MHRYLNEAAVPPNVDVDVIELNIYDTVELVSSLMVPDSYPGYVGK
jgi:hypothetical protein